MSKSRWTFSRLLLPTTLSSNNAPSTPDKRLLAKVPWLIVVSKSVSWWSNNLDNHNSILSKYSFNSAWWAFVQDLFYRGSGNACWTIWSPLHQLAFENLTLCTPPRCTKSKAARSRRSRLSFIDHGSVHLPTAMLNLSAISNHFRSSRQLACASRKSAVV